MKLNSPQSVAELAAFLHCTYKGSPDHLVTGINEIHMVEAGDLVFVDHPKYYQKALDSAATTILIDQEVDVPAGKALLISPVPFDDFNRLTRHFSPQVHHQTMRGSEVEIDPSAVIYPNVFIGSRVTIGANVILYPGVVIHDDTRIDENVVVGANSVIGHTAFYYKRKPTGYDRLHSCGGVWLQAGVELGSSCTIDKGVSGLTIVGAGSKLDNQVHIGHDTVIGRDVLMAAQVGIAGCTTIEDRVILWGQVGCASDVVVGEGAVVLAQSGISKSLEGGKTYFGSPAGEVKEKFKEMAALRQLPVFLRKK